MSSSKPFRKPQNSNYGFTGSGCSVFQGYVTARNRKPEGSTVIVILALSPDISTRTDNRGKETTSVSSRQAIQAEGIDVTVQTATVNAVQEAPNFRILN